MNDSYCTLWPQQITAEGISWTVTILNLDYVFNCHGCALLLHKCDSHLFPNA